MMLALEAIKDVTKLMLIVAGMYLAVRVYAHHRQPTWTDALDRRRVAILWLLLFVASAIKVSEDALRGESGPIDRAILLFIREQTPPSLIGVFTAVTVSGSANTLLPLTITATLALLLAKRRFEAALLAGSVISAAVVVYLVKLLAGRARPALWETQWYWGSSFPSGHTLVVAAFATAAALVVSRLRPWARGVAYAAALLWIVLIGVSRLVLGVHWPTDVLAAACIGAALPLALSIGLETCQRW